VTGPRSPRRLWVATLALLFTPAGAAAADPADPDVVAGTAGYLVEQLEDDGLATTTFDGETYVDHGLTADIVLALQATGGQDDQVEASTAALVEQQDDYTGAAFGDRYAGSFAKLALVLLSTGEDASDVLAQLEDLTQGPDEEQPGRISDDTADGDFSNVITQSLAILAFIAQGEEPPETALGFLVDDQCDSGGFTDEFGDAPDCEGDPDATGLAAQALLAGGADDAAGDAVAWLEGARTDEGAWVSDDVDGEPVPNANSTGVATQALAAAGRDTEASRSFLVDLVDPDTCGIRYQTGAEEADVRATVQAVPALVDAPILALADGTNAPADAGADRCRDGGDTADEAAAGDDPAADDDQVAEHDRATDPATTAGTETEDGLGGVAIGGLVVLALVIGGGALLLRRRRASDAT
jgi:hypothetical protein